MDMTKNTNNVILLKALYDGNLQFVEKLLTNKSVTDNLDYANIKGENALLLCLHFEYRQMALKILDYDNIGLEQIDHSLNNTLIMAIKKQYEDVALKILNKGFKDINYVDTYGDSALTCALHYNQFSIIDKLLTYSNLNVNHIDNHGDTALIIAISSFKEDIALKIIMNYKVNIHFVQQKNNFNALSLALNNKMTKLVNYLVEQGANTIDDSPPSHLYSLNNDIVSTTNKTNHIFNPYASLNNNINEKKIENNIFVVSNKINHISKPSISQNANFQESALENAVNNGDEKICIDMINKNNTNVETITRDNDTILILALKNYMYNLSTLLIKKGSASFLKHINNNKDTALFLCITNGYWDLVEDIINKKYYDVNNLNISNNCLLIYIINNGNEELALKVFNNNKDIINVNIINNDNDSLLLLAVVNGMKKLAIKIIEKINVEFINKPNSFNDTVLLLAIHFEYWDIVANLIEKKNINLNHINNNGDNALLLIINSRQWDLVEKLLNNPYIDKYHKNKITAFEMLSGSNEIHLLKYF